MRRSLVSAAFVLIVLLGALRLAHLGASVTGDEGHTLRNYASQPLSYITSNYQAANNHVLLSILLRAVDSLSPRALIDESAPPHLLRAPSCLASVAALVLMFLVARRLLSPFVALVAVAFLGASFWHLIYSHLMRGYSLSVFLNLLGVWLVVEGFLRRRTRLLLLLPPVVTAAHYTIPVNALFTVSLAAWAAALLWRERERAGLLAAALATGAALTAWSYLPIVVQVLDAGRAQMSLGASAAALPGRLAAVCGVTGLSPWYRAFFLGLACLGAVELWRRRKRRGAAGVLVASYLLLPPLILTAQRVAAPERVFTSALPAWCLLAAAGACWAAARLRRVLGVRRPRALVSSAALASLVLLASSGELRAFWSWNRGMDLRRVVERASSLTRDDDDFVLILTTRGDAWLGDPLSWEYHAYTVGLIPYWRMTGGEDFRHLARRKYLVAAPDDAQARAALERSGVDPILTAALRRLETVGRLGLYETSVDDAVLGRYRAQSRRGADPRLAAACRTGLAAEALRRGDLSDAVALLEPAKASAPDDVRTRFLLGMAYYLAYAEQRAGAEFERVLELDPDNVHARLYLADTLLWRGRPIEALRLYGWYAGLGAQRSWFLKRRAESAYLALREGGPQRLRADFASGRSDADIADALAARGTYERAALVAAAAYAKEPSAAGAARLAFSLSWLHRYREAEAVLRAGLSRGEDADARAMLVQVLVNKHDLPAARLELAPLLRTAPGDGRVRALQARLDRSW